MSRNDQMAVSAVYVISVASRICKLHPQTLRTYERMGFLAPARSAGGVRLYSEEDLQILGRIATLVSEGVNLEGVRRILQLEADLAAQRKEIDELRAATTSGAQSQARHRVAR